MLPTTNSVRSRCLERAFSMRASEASWLGATFWCLVAASAFEAVPIVRARARIVFLNMASRLLCADGSVDRTVQSSGGGPGTEINDRTVRSNLIDRRPADREMY